MLRSHARRRTLDKPSANAIGAGENGCPAFEHRWQPYGCAGVWCLGRWPHGQAHFIGRESMRVALIAAAFAALALTACSQKTEKEAEATADHAGSTAASAASDT